jgi:hypothetical protein
LAAIVEASLFRSRVQRDGFTELAVHANWPTFVKIGKAVLYPVAELDAWDKKNTVICRGAKVSVVNEREGA